MLVGIGVAVAGWLMQRAERQRLVDRRMAEQDIG
jgi:hypothetical protein